MNTSSNVFLYCTWNVEELQNLFRFIRVRDCATENPGVVLRFISRVVAMVHPSFRPRANLARNNQTLIVFLLIYIFLWIDFILFPYYTLFKIHFTNWGEKMPHSKGSTVKDKKTNDEMIDWWVGTVILAFFPMIISIITSLCRYGSVDINRLFWDGELILSAFL